MLPCTLAHQKLSQAAPHAHGSEKFRLSLGCLFCEFNAAAGIMPAHCYPICSRLGYVQHEADILKSPALVYRCFSFHTNRHIHRPAYLPKTKKSRSDSASSLQRKKEASSPLRQLVIAYAKAAGIVKAAFSAKINVPRKKPAFRALCFITHVILYPIIRRCQCHKTKNRFS